MSTGLWILLTLINIPIVAGVWWLFFRTWGEFWYCFKYILKPNWFSWMESEYGEDASASIKLILWFLLIPGLYFVELWVLPNSWTGGQRDRIEQRFAERASQKEQEERVQARGFEILRGGQAYGPYPYKELRWMIIRGEVLATDQVRWYGNERWITIDELKETARQFLDTSSTAETENASP